MYRKPARIDAAALVAAQDLVERVLQVDPTDLRMSTVSRVAHGANRPAIALAIDLLGGDARPRWSRFDLVRELLARASFVQAPVDPGYELRVTDPETGETWSEAYDTFEARTAAVHDHREAGRRTLGIDRPGEKRLTAEQEAEVEALFASFADGAR